MVIGANDMLIAAIALANGLQRGDPQHRRVQSRPRFANRRLADLLMPRTPARSRRPPQLTNPRSGGFQPPMCAVARSHRYGIATFHLQRS
jgi:hypothetical protein